MILFVLIVLDYYLVCYCMCLWKAPSEFEKMAAENWKVDHNSHLAIHVDHDRSRTGRSVAEIGVLVRFRFT